jgi:transcription-repair coupling factor (superfamily II helicase)
MSAPFAIVRHPADAWLDRLAGRLAGGGGARVACPSMAAAGFLAWLCFREFGRHVVAVAESPRLLDELHPALAAFAGESGEPVLYYPAQDLAPGRTSDPERDVSGSRLGCLERFDTAAGPLMVATCVQALQQLTWPASALRGKVRRLAPGSACDLEGLALELEAAGYEFVPEVQFRGQAARRGGILDAWPPALSAPCRIEFLGNTIESLRAFDPGTQISVGRLEGVALGPVDEWKRSGAGPGPLVPFVSHLRGPGLVLWVDLEGILTGGSGQGLSGIVSHARAYEEAAAEADARDRLLTWDDLLGRLAGVPELGQVWLGSAGGSGGEEILDPGLRRLEHAPAAPAAPLEPDVMESARRRLLEHLESWSRPDGTVHFFFGTPGARDRFRETHPDSPFHLHLGRLPDGFLAPARRLAVVSEANWIGRRKIATGRYDPHARRRRHRAAAGATITDHLALEPGDLVVHVQHGIGRYLGLYPVDFHGRKREALAIAYAEGGKLYVPVSQAHLLSRYIGMGGGGRVELHRLGGGRWAREKEAAERAVADLAALLLETQALRATRPGFAFDPDGPWQHEFEDAFPYQETEDQERAVREVKADMESPRPMDRLVCGDVGYGKTEVALRAAFKAVLGGRQAVVLAPTTVLAQQHYDLFAERLAAYPVRVELLCRFRTPSEQARVVREAASGRVDILIGTHRLLQADVALPRLGLVIIDEEQRFGVAHKEWLKRHSHLADVLTLTATPIPRTLYMSLTGVKDISIIQTPPRERQPVETILAENRDELVRAAILRELQRGGQVYYLHNRVKTIAAAHERLARLVPEARIAVGHGRMPTAELAAVMRRFAAGDTDVLLCTTIIESGVDIPNVNTILIDRADRFGLADLYQLRGRVGRSPRKGYAYLLLPGHGRVLDAARKRLKAILEHTDLGAGFQLAMRDLEVRGSGNLLGAEQSGHIAAIGFDLYCQLLRETVAGLEAEAAGPGGRAVKPRPRRRADADLDLDFLEQAAGTDSPDHAATLPADYVEDERLRVDLYRALASAATARDVQALRAQWRDRFGPLPPPAERLLKLALIRLAAAELGAQSVEVKDRKIMVSRSGDYVMAGHQFPRLAADGPDAMLDELLAWLRKLRQAEGSAS